VGDRRLQSAASLALTAAGAVLLAAGPAGLRHVADLVGAYAGLLLLATAILSAAAAVLPRGARTGPLLFGAAGIAVLGFQRHATWYGNRWAIIGLLFLVAGGSMASRSPSLRAVAESPPILRRYACLFRTRFRLTHEDNTPRAIKLTAVAGGLHANLVDAKAPGGDGFEIFVTCWAGGHVELRLPRHWPVYAGRMSAATAIHCEGKFDDTDYYPDPSGTDAQRLRDQATRFGAKQSAAAGQSTPVWVVVHIAGFVGSVDVGS